MVVECRCSKMFLTRGTIQWLGQKSSNFNGFKVIFSVASRHYNKKILRISKNPYARQIIYTFVDIVSVIFPFRHYPGAIPI